MDRIRTYVICNHGRHVAVDDVARFVGMNKSAFCVFFRKMAGKTFVQYLNEYRIQMACRMLEKGEKSVSEVCYAVGSAMFPTSTVCSSRRPVSLPASTRRTAVRNKNREETYCNTTLKRLRSEKVEGLGVSVKSLNTRHSSLNVSTLCAASIMPISQWMYYRKLRSACMRLTVRSLYKAVLQQILIVFLSRTRVSIAVRR